MKKWRLAMGVGLCLLAVLAAMFALRGNQQGPLALAIPADTVVLVVLDGVRPDELLSGIDPNLSTKLPNGSAMPYLMGEMAPQGTFWGTDTGPAAFRLGHPMGISIPSYQSIFTGRLTACLSNDCGPPIGRTLLSDISQGFGAADENIGFFSSDTAICGTVGLATNGSSTLCGARDGSDLPDAMVGQAALQHLVRARPRFMFIGLGESDRIGHGGNYGRYLETLGAYDAFLRQLAGRIDDLQAQGHRVSLLVTTDHGRGEGDAWTEHRWNVKGSGRLWLLAMGHGIAAQGSVTGTGSLYDIRATVAYLLGLRPAGGWFQGGVMAGLLASLSGQPGGQ